MGGATNPRGGRRAAIWGWPRASDELARSPARCRRPHGLARSDAAQGGKDALGRQIEQGPPLGAERVGQTSRPLRPDVADSEEHGWKVVGNTATVGGLAELLGQGRPNRPAASPRDSSPTRPTGRSPSSSDGRRATATRGGVPLVGGALSRRGGHSRGQRVVRFVRRHVTRFAAQRRVAPRRPDRPRRPVPPRALRRAVCATASRVAALAVQARVSQAAMIPACRAWTSSA